MTHFSTPFPPAPGARVLSLGGYQPANVVTNDDLAVRVDTSDEWIRSRVGIVSRRYAGPEETVTDMAVAAGGHALGRRGPFPRGLRPAHLATCSNEVTFTERAGAAARPGRHHPLRAPQL